MKEIAIGSRLELFVDRYLLDRVRGVSLRMHRPQPFPLARCPIRGGYLTIIKDGDLYRAYYRGNDPHYLGDEFDGNPGEITRYAQSRDGHEWTFPELGLFEIDGSKKNNVILAGQAPCSHNFSPFVDACPDKDDRERFKALSGTHPGGGLYAHTSADGVHWQKMQDAPVMTSKDFAFDSQNTSFWSEAEKCYVCFFRTWNTPHGELRTFSKSTSPDFIHWNRPKPIVSNLPGEHLYTSQAHPYFRAPHLYVALPTRFAPLRGDSTEILFMTSRSGARFARPFREAFIRPGMDPARWGNRANYAGLGVVPTCPGEMSIYHAGSGHRYTLRTDGFVSVNAPHKGGELITKPLIFEGRQLVLNLSTSATGSVQVEIQRADRMPVPGFALEECPAIVGDQIEHVVSWWCGADVSSLAGTPVRLRFLMKDCDLYSLQFC
ncbi:MAG: hypothetical protein V1800_00965 [Candidatus Latescibacterota bacterium]